FHQLDLHSFPTRRSSDLIISKNADLEDAAIGCVRSAFGLQGQKCSANSRIFVEQDHYEPFVKRVVELTNALHIGDPTMQNNWFRSEEHTSELQSRENLVC